MRPLPKRIRLLFVAIALLATAAAAQAPYPYKPIRLIVPQSAGGPSDTVARLVGRKLGEVLGQPILVDNKTGAGGNIGTDLTAKAAPDGYTLLINLVSSLAINETLFPKLPYSLERELTPAGLLASTSLTLVAHPSLQVGSVRDVIALAKANPGELNVASTGTGSIMHVSIELLNKLADIKLRHVPYKGAAPALTDLLGGHIKLGFIGTPAALPLINQGKLIGLATTGTDRSLLLPNLPTMIEAGMPGFDAEAIHGLWVTAGTPPDRVERLSTALREVLRSQEVSEQLSILGFDARPTTPQQHAAYLKSEIVKWAPIVKASGAVPD